MANDAEAAATVAWQKIAGESGSPYMIVPVQRIQSAPSDTLMLLDMTPRLYMHGIEPNLEPVVIPATGRNMQEVLEFCDKHAPELQHTLELSVLPALRKVAGRLDRMSPKEKMHFDQDCLILCVMEERAAAIPLPIFYYKEPCCANSACRKATRDDGSTLLRCTGCHGMALYCRKECQLQDRRIHKHHCKLLKLIPQDQLQEMLDIAGRDASGE